MLAAVSAERALLAVDTLGAELRAGVPREHAKMLVLPHLNVAIAVSGSLSLLTWITGFIAFAECRDFDAVASAVLHDRLVDRAEEGMRGQMSPAVRADCEREEQLAVLVGHSAELRRMRAVAANRAERHAAYTTQEIGWLVSPPLERSPTSFEAMVAIAREQVAKYGETCRGLIGGRLIIADVTRDSTTTTSKLIGSK